MGQAAALLCRKGEELLYGRRQFGDRSRRHREATTFDLFTQSTNAADDHRKTRGSRFKADIPPRFPERWNGHGITVLEEGRHVGDWSKERDAWMASGQAAELGIQYPIATQ